MESLQIFEQSFDVFIRDNKSQFENTAKELNLKICKDLHKRAAPLTSISIKVEAFNSESGNRLLVKCACHFGDDSGLDFCIRSHTNKPYIESFWIGDEVVYDHLRSNFEHIEEIISHIA
jgi:hypothetical protein